VLRAKPHRTDVYTDQAYGLPESFWRRRCAPYPSRIWSARHRLLHFAARHTVITVAELLDVFPIAKQSVLRSLNDKLYMSYAEAFPSMKAPRQHQLKPALRGEALASEAAQLQQARIAPALNSLADGARVLGFLRALADPGRRNKHAATTGARAFFGCQGLHP
jgi:hypothetical protein